PPPGHGDPLLLPIREDREDRLSGRHVVARSVPRRNRVTEDALERIRRRLQRESSTHRLRSAASIGWSRDNTPMSGRGPSGGGARSQEQGGRRQEGLSVI